MVKITVFLSSLFLSGLCLSSSAPAPVSTLDYFVKLANRNGACKGLKSKLLKNGIKDTILEKLLVRSFRFIS